MYLIGDLSTLPTTGTAWTYMKSKADSTWPAPNICDQNNKTGVLALAAGMVYARVGGETYKTKVIDACKALMTSQKDGCTNAALAAGRQLGAWVLASDLVGYKDVAWVNWLLQMRTRNLGGHGRWTSLRFTQSDSSNNWGAFAQSSLCVIDRYLEDTTSIALDWKIFQGFAGNRLAHTFRTPSISQPSWLCIDKSKWTPIQLCTDPKKTGAPTEDAWRSGAYPNISKTYVAETMQGLALAAEMLSRAGYTAAWEKLRPLANFATVWAVWNASSVGYHLPWWYNSRLGINAPTRGAQYGRTFGYTDWWR